MYSDEGVRCIPGHGSKGLVHITHSSPKRFRAVPLDESTKTLCNLYVGRVEHLRDTIEIIESTGNEETADQHVWSMVGCAGIETRTHELILVAEDEIVLIISDGSLVTNELINTIQSVSKDILVIVGAVTEL